MFLRKARVTKRHYQLKLTEEAAQAVELAATECGRSGSETIAELIEEGLTSEEIFLNEDVPHMVCALLTRGQNPSQMTEDEIRRACPDSAWTEFDARYVQTHRPRKTGDN